MSRSKQRTYSRYSKEAARLLGALIREARISKRMTAQELADRAGISRGLLYRIEKGNLKCEIGMVFETAVIVGIRLFDGNESVTRQALMDTREKLTLLPKSVRRKSYEVDDDF